MADVLDIDDPNAKDYDEPAMDDGDAAGAHGAEASTIDQDDNVITTRTVTVVGGSNPTTTDADENGTAARNDSQSVVRELKERAIKKKGRGFRDRENAAAAAAASKSASMVRSYDDDNDYEMGNADDIAGTNGEDLIPVKSIEGWVIFVSGLHEETQEDVMMDKFSEFGSVRNMHMNPDRRTGFIKGYAIIEFDSYDEAALAIKTMDGQSMYGKQLRVTWAFAKPEHVRRRR